MNPLRATFSALSFHEAKSEAKSAEILLGDELGLTYPTQKQMPFLRRHYHRAFSLGAMRPHHSSILPFLNRPNGKYLEVGARDGGRESFTLYLEKCLRWQGLLVEPWPHLFHKCRKRRKRSTTLNVAAVDSWLSDSYIEVHGLPPKTSIRERLRQEASARMNDRPVTAPPIKRSRNQKHIFFISTNSIQGMLDRSNFNDDFDLLVLNLQGYESNALDGIDFGRFKPTFILFRLSNATVAMPNIPLQYEKVATSVHDKMTNAVLFRYAEYGSN